MARAFGSNQPKVLSLDIDNEQGRFLFRDPQKLGDARLSAQTLFTRNLRSSAVSPPGPNYSGSFRFLAEAVVART